MKGGKKGKKKRKEKKKSGFNENDQTEWEVEYFCHDDQRS